MAAFNKFDAFAAFMPNAGVNLNADTVKLMLTNTIPVHGNSVYGDISANEVAGVNGYLTGGFALTLVSSTQTLGTYKYIATATPTPTWTATGAMAPFRYIVCYSTAGGKALIGWWDIGSVQNLVATNTFTATPDGTNGIFQLA